MSTPPEESVPTSEFPVLPTWARFPYTFFGTDFGFGSDWDIFGTAIGFSPDWGVIVSDSVLFFMWGLNSTVFIYMAGSGGDRQEAQQD